MFGYVALVKHRANFAVAIHPIVTAMFVAGSAHAQVATAEASAPSTTSSASPAAATAEATPPIAVTPAAPMNLGSPRAFMDYSDGTFFSRSGDDNLVLATGGRVHIDTYASMGPGLGNYHKSNGAVLGPNMFFRRFVLESGGIVRNKYFFWIGGNFAPTTIDGNQATSSTAAVYDGFVGYQADPNHQIYVGQNNTPITMENVTSSRWLDFMERALVVRTVAAPYNKDLGVTYWGASRSGVAPIEYQVGLYGGDGMNRPNVDTRMDTMARVIVRPLAESKEAIGRLHIGGSARYGSRDSRDVNYDAPTMSTPGGFAYWSPVYTAADKTEVHIIPSGKQLAVSGEFYAPFENFDLRGEVVYVNEGRREAASTARGTSLREGTLEGFGGYVQVNYWPMGNVRINGNPAGRYFGLKAPTSSGNQYPEGLQLAARAEILRLSYDGNSRSDNVADGAISAKTSNIQVNALQGIVNYWATKHIRLSAEYSLYMFPGSPPSAGASATNQAAAPGAKASPADPSADTLHELSFRVGLAL